MSVSKLAPIAAALLLAAIPGPSPAQAPTAHPPSCSAAGAVTPICGVQAPEDIAPLPDGNHMIVSQLPVGADHRQGGGLVLLDLATDRVAPLPLTAAYRAGWGEAACTAPVPRLGSHGISLIRRRDGVLALLVVNHFDRESIEAYEVTTGPEGPAAIWHGCVTDRTGLFNDVAGTPDGGFVATIALDKALLARPDGFKIATSGAVTGYLVSWHPGGALERLPNSEAPFNNGIQLSPDGRYAYFNAWTANRIVRYDIQDHRVTGQVALAFHPDNLSIRADGRMIAAGIDELDSWNRCMADHSAFCATAVSTAVFDPRTMSATPLWHAPANLIAGASVAVEIGRTLYVGSYSGDRILKVRLDDHQPPAKE